MDNWSSSCVHREAGSVYSLGCYKGIDLSPSDHQLTFNYNLKGRQLELPSCSSKTRVRLTIELWKFVCFPPSNIKQHPTKTTANSHHWYQPSMVRADSSERLVATNDIVDGQPDLSSVHPGRGSGSVLNYYEAAGHSPFVYQ
jgi:hypothetical protein